MRKYLLSFVIVLICLIYSSSAQFGGDLFKAKEGWDAIKDSLGGMHLVMVLAQQSIESPLKVDLENGTADGWLYFVRNPQDTNQNALLIVMKDGDEWFWFPVSENEDMIEGLKPLNDISWMDSDEFIAQLNKNQIYTDYLKSVTDLYSVMMALVYYPYDMGDEMPPQFYQKYNWMLEINDELRCVVNSETGETECEVVVSGVKDISEKQDILIYPQPAENIVNIRKSVDMTISSFEVYNQLGQKTFSHTGTLNDSFSFSTEEFHSGIYIIKFFTQQGAITKLINVIK